MFVTKHAELVPLLRALDRMVREVALDAHPAGSRGSGIAISTSAASAQGEAIRRAVKRGIALPLEGCLRAHLCPASPPDHVWPHRVRAALATRALRAGRDASGSRGRHHHPRALCRLLRHAASRPAPAVVTVVRSGPTWRDGAVRGPAPAYHSDMDRHDRPSREAPELTTLTAWLATSCSPEEQATLRDRIAVHEQRLQDLAPAARTEGVVDALLRDATTNPILASVLHGLQRRGVARRQRHAQDN